MRLPRMTTRRWMIAVAVLCLTFGGLAGLQRMNERSQRFRALARNHLHQETVDRLALQGSEAHGAAKAITEKHRMLTEYHRALNLKYKRAARLPWLPVPPDPPKPE